MKQKWFVIVNPTSGNGTSKKKWPLIKNELLNQQFEFEFCFTEYKNHASILLQTAINNGFNNFICVGGDGTLHETINGLLNFNNTNEFTIGIIPIGTGNDWIRTYSIPLNYKKAIALLKQQNCCYQDIGKITYKHSKKTIYFNNLAGIGFDGYVVNNVSKFKKLGVLAYLITAITSLASFKKPHLKISFNNEQLNQPILLVLVGICNYSGGGMRLTKDPNPTDQLFDVSIIEKITLLTLLKNLPKLFNGKITNHKLVKNYKTNALTIKPLHNISTYMQADGELIETAECSISIHPNLLKFIVPKKK